MAKSDERLKAENLRRKGWSINRIATFLGVSKSSASGWCKNIALTKSQKARLIQNTIKAGHRGRMIGAEKNKQKKIDTIQSYQEMAHKFLTSISKRDLILVATALYWAEGAKTDGRFMFINSDPMMILVMYAFIIQILKVNKKNLRPTIQINKIHEKRIKEVHLYWAKLLGIPIQQFSKPYYINSIPKKIYANYNQYYGILRLRVLKGTNFQYRVLGLIDAIKRHYMPV